VKLREYFRIPTVQHYLIVWPDRRQVVHHRRDGQGITTNTLGAGARIELMEPNVSLSVDAFYA
jgi:Uma2 family endonuclease